MKICIFSADTPGSMRFFSRVLHSLKAETSSFPALATLIQTVCHGRHGRPTIIGVSLKVVDGKDWARAVDTTVILSDGKLEFPVGKPWP